MSTLLQLKAPYFTVGIAAAGMLACCIDCMNRAATNVQGKLVGCVAAKAGERGSAGSGQAGTPLNDPGRLRGD